MKTFSVAATIFMFVCVMLFVSPATFAATNTSDDSQVEAIDSQSDSSLHTVFSDEDEAADTESNIDDPETYVMKKNRKSYDPEVLMNENNEDVENENEDE